MPRGVKVKTRKPPAIALCDFCGRKFGPLAWNERTCYSCGRDGAPNQSKLTWATYRRTVSKFLRAIGRKAPLAGVAASPQSKSSRRFGHGLA